MIGYLYQRAFRIIRVTIASVFSRTAEVANFQENVKTCCFGAMVSHCRPNTYAALLHNN